MRHRRAHLTARRQSARNRVHVEFQEAQVIAYARDDLVDDIPRVVQPQQKINYLRLPAPTMP